MRNNINNAFVRGFASARREGVWDSGAIFPLLKLEKRSMIGQVYAPAFLPPERETSVAFELMVHAHRYVETVHCSLLSSSQVVFILIVLFVYIKRCRYLVSLYSN